jgi:hypothetical protein
MNESCSLFSIDKILKANTGNVSTENENNKTAFFKITDKALIM